ncbi:signal peptidase I [Aquisphaera giovannonii]|uniref:signal peptidase I n=1 Tax=Aquisphaera giovannonii TaxID=406548 RepID=A0A5B9W0H5_9BACT|nr:S26 family signal peptidase [Aquisphaera giovannonii]QEH33759.1 signal peptidase I [Aquisphaera giovannonii]
MTRQPKRSSTLAPAPAAAVRTSAAEAAKKRRDRRESVESVVVVVVAFLLWSFEAEGFVIPTGSMAPTLMGRHKDVTCPECGHVYTVNADSEVDSSGSGASTGVKIVRGTCENCRCPARVDGVPSVAGDRIYTMKKGLHLPLVPALGEVGPRRWEIAVFKVPEEPEVRYIKRQVGLPSEIVRLQQGDLWRRPLDESEPFARLRRPFAHQKAMQVLVYDDAHRARSLRDDPRWDRWASSSDGWSESSPGRFAVNAAAESWSELRYRNLVPEPRHWDAIADGEKPPAPRTSLVTDFCSYNTDLSPHWQSNPRLASRPWLQPHWVGDLTLSGRVKITQPTGTLRLALIKGGRLYHADVDLQSGRATLLRDDEPLGEAAATRLNEVGEHSFTLSNVDDRLTLEVDGNLPFGDGLPYDSGGADGLARPASADLEPARIAARGVPLEVAGLQLRRDVYYTLSPGDADLPGLESLAFQGPNALFDLLADPEAYGRLGQPGWHDYPIGPGRYMMLGDNSPWSRDGRAWGRKDQVDPEAPGLGWDESGRESWEVPESLIIGKAFWVYWPHLQPMWPAWQLGDYRFPVRPNFEQIRWIR